MKTVDTDLVEIKGDQLFGAKEFLEQLQGISKCNLDCWLPWYIVP